MRCKGRATTTPTTRLKRSTDNRWKLHAKPVWRNRPKTNRLPTRSQVLIGGAPQAPQLQDVAREAGMALLIMTKMMMVAMRRRKWPQINLQRQPGTIMSYLKMSRLRNHQVSPSLHSLAAKMITMATMTMKPREASSKTRVGVGSMRLLALSSTAIHPQILQQSKTYKRMTTQRRWSDF